ncbi:histidine phosphatase superfamily protein (branch 1) [Pontibacter ummariensis]|uniref:Histidine phosphatase superfamily (Branch 1) n=1 Tax=Pontibacter ummariensis TaxID=1610492 RepID=A0A239BFP1_9BACT|nr:histidine phosphatase family protein [Pontibacter ummariensis]PRY16536.1 histidine phosphatase superfamily protein (branch 1) [Pontibacter ummariensis]SNS06917.1 Histidine phosphatase superfamily (branch 1) [Pontibacter ummariensis]
MKSTLLLKLWLILLVCCFTACRNSSSSIEGASPTVEPVSSSAPPVKVYLVRHAEKDISNPSDEDPGLTPQGQHRAEALQALLEGQEVDALYATKYQRTKNTLKPLADARQLEIRQYEAHDFKGLKQQLLENHSGETVVVAGHSNTLLPIIEALGAKRPVPDVSDAQYDYLFTVTVTPEGTATVETDHYGTANR